MATLWSYQSNASGAAVNTGSVSAVSATYQGAGSQLQVNDLLIGSGQSHGSTGSSTGLTISDNGSGGWLQIAVVGTASAQVLSVWIKLVTASDVSLTTTYSVTSTQAGLTGTRANYVEFDCFRLPAGFIVVPSTCVDTTGTTGPSGSSAHTATWAASSGTPKVNADHLAFTAGAWNTSGSNGGITGTNVFTGDTNYNLSVTPFSDNVQLANQYAFGCGINTTLASNAYTNTWATNRVNVLFVGLSLVYQSSFQPNTFVPARQGRFGAVNRAANFMKDAASDLFLPPKARERIVLVGV